MKKTLFRKSLAILLSSLVLVQPALAQQNTYKFSLRGLVVTPATTGGSGGDTGGEVTPPLPGVAGISYSTASLDFDNVTVGSSVSQAVLVTSTGTEPLTLSALPSVSGDSAFTTQSDCPASLSFEQFCTVTVTFSPSQSRGHTAALNFSSNVPGGAPTVLLEGTGTTAAVSGVDLSTTALGFPGVPTGSTQSKTVLVLSAGSAPLVLSGLPTITGSAAFTAATNCPLTIPAGDECAVTVSFAPTQGTNYTGALNVNSNAPGGTRTVALSGSGTSSIATAQLAAATNNNFGTLATSATATRSFTVTNTGTATATGVFASLTSQDGLSMTTNTCGVTGTPVTLAPGLACDITLTLNSAENIKLTNVVLQVQGSFSNGPVSTAIVGQVGNFDVNAVWSNAAGSNAEVAGVGTTTPGRTLSKNIYLRNTGTFGALSSSFALSGDTSQFELTAVSKIGNSGGGSTCNATTTTLASTTCTSDSIGQARPNIIVSVRYKPTTLGTHSITVTPTSTNGSALPAPLTITAVSAFDATGTWSNDQVDIVAVTNFDTTTPGVTKDKQIWLHNTGTYGALSSAFTLGGDVANFEIVGLISHGNSSSTGTCDSSFSGNRTVVSECAANFAGVGLDNLRLTVRYKPTTTGTHTLSITPSSTNGSTLPAPLVLTGTAIFDSVGVWSGAAGSNTALANYATSTPGVSTTKDIWLRNTGTYGELAAAFTLSGDVSQFEFVSATRHNNSVTDESCSSIRSTDRTSLSTCITESPSYRNILVKLAYKPTVAGNHSITITAVSNNGSVMPTPLTLTGTSVFDPTGVWSGAVGSTQPLANYNQTSVGAALSKDIYLRNVGTFGGMHAAFTLGGDTSHFEITYSRSVSATGSSTANCGTIAVDKKSTTTCEATTPSANRHHILIKVSYKPLSAGTHTLIVIPTTTNNSTMPTALTLTGNTP